MPKPLINKEELSKEEVFDLIYQELDYLSDYKANISHKISIMETHINRLYDLLPALEAE